ncbi:MAG: hypothetical protein COY81_01680 [Candidatus Pacebacteria bacterium CG_4_10_14_0_8_um_filter_43_12]|nr:MAG: hypothetical protein COY81_01680 [Candidatus Pacebacteria bacterium CG_4_10_14_0_8_um_filter_43_12]
MKTLGSQDFLNKLKQEAQAQAKLEQTRFLPAELDWLTSYIGCHSWQVLLITSGLTSLALEGFRWLL